MLAKNQIWLAQLRRALPSFWPRRNSLNLPASQQAQKLTPIAKVLAEAGRNSTTPAD